MNNNLELYHYGVLGQRWGVRRTERQLNTNRPSHSSYGDRNKMKSMTNDELESRIRRMELEKRYRDLNPKKVSAGQRFVANVMNKTVVPAATEATKQMLKDYIIKSAKK